MPSAGSVSSSIVRSSRTQAVSALGPSSVKARICCTFPQDKMKTSASSSTRFSNYGIHTHTHTHRYTPSEYSSKGSNDGGALPTSTKGGLAKTKRTFGTLLSWPFRRRSSPTGCCRTCHRSGRTAGCTCGGGQQCSRLAVALLYCVVSYDPDGVLMRMGWSRERRGGWEGERGKEPASRDKKEKTKIQG